MGLSVGSPTDGHLLGGSRLEDTPYLRVLPAYASDDARWGLGSLVAMIDRSAKAVRREFPDAVLAVGHLSRRGGGDIDRHASHESGRDADLSFFIRSQTHHPLHSDHMVSFRADGTAPSWPGALFDDARNWALVSAIVQETHAHVTYIFVAAPLRARLLAYATHIGASPAIRTRAAELMVQPHGSLPHDDHFHVRIGCPSGMAACVEFPTRARATTRVTVRHHGSSAPVASARGMDPAVQPVTKRPAPHAAEPVAARPQAASPPAPAAPVSPVEDAPAPAASAAPAALAVPFDDVDGPVVTTPGPGDPAVR
jgi:penicillin-insensitive murein endopeptidase